MLYMVGYMLQRPCNISHKYTIGLSMNICNAIDKTLRKRLTISTTQELLIHLLLKSGYKRSYRNTGKISVCNANMKAASVYSGLQLHGNLPRYGKAEQAELIIASDSDRSSMS